MENFEGLLLSWSIVSRILFEIRFSECNSALSNKLEKLVGWRYASRTPYWRILLIPKKAIEEMSHVFRTACSEPSKIHYCHNHTTWADYARKSCVIIFPIHEVILGRFSCVIIYIIFHNHTRFSQKHFMS